MRGSAKRKSAEIFHRDPNILYFGGSTRIMPRILILFTDTLHSIAEEFEATEKSTTEKERPTASEEQETNKSEEPSVNVEVFTEKPMQPLPSGVTEAHQGSEDAGKHTGIPTA